MTWINRVLGAFLVLIAGLSAAAAQNCAVYPNILTNGTTADANQVMADFNLIRNCANNNLAHSGANSDITSITGLTTPLAVSQGGTPLFVGGTSTGSANAQVVASTTPNSFSLTQGWVVGFVAGFNNSASTTLNVNSTGVKTIQKMSGGALANLVSGDIKLGTEYYVTWDGSVYELLNPSTVGMTGPGSSTNGDVASFNGTTGNVLQDSGILASQVVTSAAALTNHQVVIGVGGQGTKVIAAGTTGQVLKGVTGADPVFGAGVGTLTAGTANTLNPYAVGTQQTQAHGLGAIPALVICFIQNTTGELGYSAGDRVYLTFGTPSALANNGFVVRADATNTYLITANTNTVQIPRADTSVQAQITAADWEAVCTPFKIN